MVGWWLVPLVVSAQDATTFSIESIGSAVGLGDTDLKVIVIRVIRWALAFLALVAVSYLIYGGYVWMTAAGNEQRVEKAKQIILQALIGIVIVLLAWAIVSFVARTVSTLTQNGNSNTGTPCVGVIGVDCPPFDPARTFNIKAIASCATPPNYQEDVPKVSNLAVYFNRKVDVTTIQAAAASHALNLQYCGTDPTCATPDDVTVPADNDNEVFVPTKPAIKNTDSNYSKTQWVSNGSNAMGIYHFERPFQTAVASAKDYYRLVFPINGNTAALMDTFLPVANPLAFCRRDDGSPIPGDDLAHSVCRTDAANHVITWTFSTKDAIAGAALDVASTIPRSNDPQRPNRNVDRDAKLGIRFSGAIDPYTLSTDNFTVRRITIPLTGPNFAYDRGTQLDPALPATFFGNPTEQDYLDNGMTIRPAGANLFEPYTWYEVTVENVRDLCGTLQTPPTYRWIFETNANKPGVRYVYPPNEYKYACPNTKVRIVFNTSMWDQGGNCQPQLGSYVRDESAGTRMTENGNPYNARLIRVVDDYNEATDDPNDRCKTYEFGTENTALRVPRTYGMTVMTNRVIDADNNVLAYGEDAGVDPPKPWHFTTTTPEECVNPPLIDRVSPSGGAQEGQCLTVIGSNFTKQGKYADAVPYPQAGDVLTYGGLDQTDLLLWENRNIVSTMQPVGLSTGITHPYSVTVRYPAPIGDLTSPEYTYMLNDGTGMSNAPCLISLSKYRGLPGTTLSATGKRFKPYVAAQSKINYSPVPATVPPDFTWPVTEPNTNWTDKRISSISVSADSPLESEGDVSVFDGGGLQSNELLFTVGDDIIPPDGDDNKYLRVEEQTQCIIPTNAEDPTIFPSPNPKRGETDASLNIRIYARFSETVQAGMLIPANIQLDRCTDNTCAAVTPENNISIIAVDGGRGFELSLLPAGTNLTRATTYRVTIRQAMAAAADPTKQLRADYSWTFTTKDNDADAPIAAVGINGATDPNPALSTPNYPLYETLGKFLYRALPFQVNMTAHALSAKCEVINYIGNITWASVNPTGKDVIYVNPAITAANNPAQNFNYPDGPTDEGRAKAKATIEGKSGVLPITYNSTYCVDDSSCATSTIGESCSGSRCIQNNCTPIVNEYSPNHGATETWTTIKGCWFGTYVGGRSTTLFSGGPPRPEGVIPDTAICPLSDTWTNTRIIREVPRQPIEASTGIITVVKPNPGGGPTDNWTADGPVFTVDNSHHPNLCRIDPRGGLRGSNVVLSGKDFGPGPGNGNSYAITMTHKNWTEGDVAHVTTSGTYGDWTDTVTGGTVPDGAEIIDNNGANNTQVISNSVPSNSVVYRVRETGDEPPPGDICLPGYECTRDNDPACGALPGQPLGCAMKRSTPCCRPVPVIETYNPTAGAVNVCRNVVPTITFSRPIDGATVTAEAISYDDGGAPLAPKFSVNNTGGKGEVRISPGLLSLGPQQQTIRFLAPDDSLKIRSSDGVIAQVPVGVPYTFTTGTDICTLSRISLDPTALYFTSRDDPSEPITSTAHAANGEVLSNTPDYRWDWSWMMANGDECDGIACVGMSTPATAPTSIGDVLVNTDANAGRTAAVVKATVTHNELKADDHTTKTARASVTLDLCNYPWYDTGDETGFTDAADNCDNVGGGCQNFNFSIHYCLGQTDDDTKWLTSFDYEGSNGNGLLGAIEGVNNTLTLGREKSIFFKADREATDAIGVLIFKNDSLSSPGDWYDANFSDALANPSSTTIGGYPAVRTGTAAYIGVTDIGDGYPDGHQGLIFVMDFNSNEAEGKTKQVYDQMLKKIEFNLNLNDEERSQLQRDTKRYQDLASIAARAENYKVTNRQYPTLNAGSYLVGISTSTWPSWQSTLGNALGRSLPIDPINKFNNCPAEEDGKPYDTRACWNEPKKKFLCPAGSNIYLYKYASDNTISLFTQMEYTGTGSFIQEAYTPCPLPSDCPCFNYQFPVR